MLQITSGPSPYGGAPPGLFQAQDATPWESESFDALLDSNSLGEAKAPSGDTNRMTFMDSSEGESQKTASSDEAERAPEDLVAGALLTASVLPQGTRKIPLSSSEDSVLDRLQALSQRFFLQPEPVFRGRDRMSDDFLSSTQQELSLNAWGSNSGRSWGASDEFSDLMGDGLEKNLSAIPSPESYQKEHLFYDGPSGGGARSEDEGREASPEFHLKKSGSYSVASAAPTEFTGEEQVTDVRDPRTPFFNLKGRPGAISHQLGSGEPFRYSAASDAFSGATSGHSNRLQNFYHLQSVVNPPTSLEESSSARGLKTVGITARHSALKKSSEVDLGVEQHGPFALGGLGIMAASKQGSALKSDSPGILNAQRVEQIQNLTELLAQQGGGTARIELAPEGLGHIELKVRVKSGQVQVDFEVSHQETAKLIEKGLQELKESLQKEALQLDVTQVRVAGNESAGSNANTSDSGQRSPWMGDFGLLRDMLGERRDQSWARENQLWQDWADRASTQVGRERGGVEPLKPASQRVTSRYASQNKGTQLDVVG